MQGLWIRQQYGTTEDLKGILNQHSWILNNILSQGSIYCRRTLKSESMMQIFKGLYPPENVQCSSHRPQHKFGTETQMNWHKKRFNRTLFAMYCLYYCCFLNFHLIYQCLVADKPYYDQWLVSHRSSRSHCDWLMCLFGKIDLDLKNNGHIFAPWYLHSGWKYSSPISRYIFLQNNYFLM